MEVRHLIAGLPRSGKTTFLAAFWHLMNAGEVSTKLELDRLTGEHQYLNTIAESWRRCEEVLHTSLQNEKKSLSIHVCNPSTNHKATLVFPDLSGESFKRQVELRRCRHSYLDACDASDGLLLFVTADHTKDDLSVLDVTSMTNGNEANSEENSTQVVEWSPELIPEQVQLVELLQFLQCPPFQRRRRRLAVIVSAWDVQTNPKLTPEDWVRRELPFLHQFLSTNGASFEFQIYGVSAQGGSVRSPEVREQLLRQTASERIECIGPHTGPHDLTSPILWLMEEGEDSVQN